MTSRVKIKLSSESPLKLDPLNSIHPLVCTVPYMRVHGRAIKKMTHLFVEFTVPPLDNEDDPEVGVQDDHQGDVEGPTGGVDHVTNVLVVPALKG